MATKTQLIGGVFQDSVGNILANGYLKFKLSQDSSVSGVGNIAAGVEITVQLDSAGNVASSTSTPPASNQFLWSNSVLLPVNSFYRVTGYTAKGQIAWGPNNQMITSGGTGGGTFDVGTWIPNSIVSWIPPVQPLVLEVNNVLNASQTLLNLLAGANVTVTDNGTGGVTIAASVAGISLKTNGVANGSQTILNLKSGSGIGLTDDGVGGVTIVANGFSPSVGMNVIPAPPPPGVGNNANPIPSVATWNQFNPAAVGPSTSQYIPGAMIIAPCSSWKLSLWQGTGTATQSFKMQIYKCNPGSLVILATAQITFGGLASPSFSTPGTILTSDTINFPLSTSFDYYVVYDTIVGFPSIGTVGVSGWPGGFVSTNTTTAENYGLIVGNSISFAGNVAEAQPLIVSLKAQS